MPLSLFDQGIESGTSRCDLNHFQAKQSGIKLTGEVQQLTKVLKLD